MKYKFVAIDLDDTLLDDDLAISAKTIDVIQEAVAKGVVVTLATGRMYKSALKYAKQLNLNVPIITYQGAYVRNVFDDLELYKKYIPYDYSLDVLSKLEAMNKTVQIYIDDELYVLEGNHYVEEYSKMTEVNYHIVDNFAELIKETSLPYKIIAINNPEKVATMLKNYEELYRGTLNVNTSKPNFLEFSNIEASKGQAIKFLAKKHNIAMEEVIAIGDSFNDLDMIEMAGLGVAMGNAHPNIKSAADYITNTNNEDGVWEVFQKFILR